MKKKILSRILVCLMILCMLIGIVPVSAFAATGTQGGQIVFANGSNVSATNSENTPNSPAVITVPTTADKSYPYATVMDYESARLCADFTGTSYQWQYSTSETGTYIDIAGARNNSYLFDMTDDLWTLDEDGYYVENYDGNWFRCVIDGVATQPVQLVQAGYSSTGIWSMNITYRDNWYVRNGKLAYSIFDNGEFDIVYYSSNSWQATSYTGLWNIGASTSSTPAQSTSTGTSGIALLKLNFNFENANQLIISAKMQSGYKSLAIGTDIFLFEDATKKPINAITDGKGNLSLIQFVKASSFSEIKSTDAAIVFKPITPTQRWWCGSSDYPSSPEGISYPTFNNDSYYGIDHAMAVSWSNLESGATVEAAFSAGTAAEVGAVNQPTADQYNYKKVNVYPYGQFMDANSTTLYANVEASSYQWQVSDNEDGAYSDVYGATSNILSLDPNNLGSHRWVRCVINGDSCTNAVQFLQYSEERNDVQAPTEGQWYIGNGAMAYSVYDSYHFDVLGKYGSDYIRTSHISEWYLYATTEANPTETNLYNSSSGIASLKINFSTTNKNNVVISAQLANGYRSLAIGTDTNLNGYDACALDAILKQDGTLAHIQMITAGSLSAMKDTDAAMVFKPTTPATGWWCGEYLTANYGVAFPDENSNSITGADSAVAVSWENLASGATVEVVMGVGTAADAGASNTPTIADYVAQVNDGTKYATVQEAINAAQDGDTVYLLKSVSVSSELLLTTNKAITLNGNGYTIKRASGNNDNLIATTNGKLTLLNITVDGGAIWEGDNPVTRVNTGLTAVCTNRFDGTLLGVVGGQLVLGNGATLQNNHRTGSWDGVSDGGSAVVVNNTAVFTMEEGSQILNCTVHNTGSTDASSGGDGAAISIWNSGAAYIKGGLISGNFAPRMGGVVRVCETNAALHISGGTITNNWAKAQHFGNFAIAGHKSTITGSPVIENNWAVPHYAADGFHLDEKVQSQFVIYNGGTINATGLNVSKPLMISFASYNVMNESTGEYVTARQAGTIMTGGADYANMFTSAIDGYRVAVENGNLVTKAVTGTVYYVDAVNGSDSNSGNRNHPFQTLDKALASYTSDCTIVLLNSEAVDGEFTNTVTKTGVFNGNRACTATIISEGNTKTIDDRYQSTNNTYWHLYASGSALILDNVIVDGTNGTKDNYGAFFIGNACSLTLQNGAVLQNYKNRAVNVRPGGTLNILEGCSILNNKADTNVYYNGDNMDGVENAGGAVYVCAGGRLNLQGGSGEYAGKDIIIKGNTGDKGAGIYLESGSYMNTSMAHAHISDQIYVNKYEANANITDGYFTSTLLYHTYQQFDDVRLADGATICDNGNQGRTVKISMDNPTPGATVVVNGQSSIATSLYSATNNDFIMKLEGANLVVESTAHGCDGVAHQAWTNGMAAPTSGNWYLTEDVTLPAGWTPTGDIHLCLNGHLLNMNGKHLHVEDVTFTVTDCSDVQYYINQTTAPVAGATIAFNTTGGEGYTALPAKGGVIYGATAQYYSAINIKGGVFNLKGGNISGNIGNTYGGAFLLNAASSGNISKLNISGGSVSFNQSNIGGIQAEAGAIVTITGGYVSYNRCSDQQAGGGISVYGAATLNILGGEISHNVGGRNGGGVFASGTNSNVVMSGGKVTDNHATYGGGFNITYSASMTFSGGSIEGNYASQGSGIFLYSNATLNMTGGSITGNNSHGVYVTGSTVNVSGNPVVTGHSYNVYLVSDGAIKVIGALDGAVLGVTLESGNLIAQGTDSYTVTATDAKCFYDDTGVNAAVKSDNTVVWQTAVAEVNGVKYETLLAAIDAASDGDIVYLLADITVTTTHNVTKNITLDLGGHEISRGSNDNMFVVHNSATFTLKNGTLDGENYGSKYNLVNLQANTSLVAENVIFTRCNSQFGTIFGSEGSIIDLTNCQIVDNQGNTGYNNSCGSAIHTYGAVKLNGCTITGNKEAHSITTDGGQSYAIHLKASATIDFSGVNIIQNNTNSSGNAANIALLANQLTVSGDIFDSKIGIYANGKTPIAQGTDSYTVTGADALCFIDDTNTYAAAKSDNTVVFVTPAVEVNGVKYASMQDAINAIPDGTQTTVKLLGDIANAITISAGKDIILDLNGHDITTTGTTLTNSGELTIINSSDEPASVVGGNYCVNNYGELNIEGDSASDITIFATGVNNAITNQQGGTIHIDGATIKSNGWYAICDQGNTTGNTITNAHLECGADGTGGAFAIGGYNGQGSEWTISEGVTMKNGDTTRPTELINTKADGNDTPVTIVNGDKIELKDTDNDGIYTVETKKLDSIEELQAAINNAQPGDVIKLDGDIIGSITIPEDADITIDLNGHKIVGTDGQAAVTNNGSLKVTDSSESKTGMIIGVGSNASGIVNHGTLDIEGVEGGIYGGAASADDVTNLTGSNSSGIYSSASGNVTITDSKVAGSVNGVASYGELTVKETVDGKTEISGQNGIVVVGGSTVINGGTITGEGNAIYQTGNANPSTTVNGGNITGGNTAIYDDSTNGTGTITGGAFTSNGGNNANTLQMNGGAWTVDPENEITINNTSGSDKYISGNITGNYVSVGKDDNTVELVKNTVEVGTLEELEQAIADGIPNIVITADIAGDIEIPEGADITIDLNGNTITGTVTNNGTLTVTDSSNDKTGEIVSEGTAIVNNGNLTLDDVTVKGKENAVSGEAITIPDGYVKVETTDGEGYKTVTVQEEKAVTVLDSNGKVIGTYDTVADAIANAPSGSTIKLNGDITGTITIPADANVVLDLNGHSIISANGNAVENSGTLTIMDSSTDKSGLIQGTNGNNAIHNSGNLTIESGTIDGDRDGINQMPGGTTVINGGTIKGNNCAICDSGSSQGNQINGGTLIAGGVSDGYVIRGWKETSSTEDAPTWTIATNGNVTMKNETTPENLIFTGEDGTASDKYNEVNVSNFDSIEFADDGNGGYTVEVKKLDSIEELQEAINNAKPGETIKLEGDIAGAITIPEGKDIILDLNGYTLGNTSNRYTVDNNGTLTVTDSSSEKNGEIIGQAAIRNYGDLTIENGTITGTSYEGIQNGYTGECTDATFTMTGGTVQGQGYAICDYASESTHTITGGTLLNTGNNGGSVLGSYNSVGGTWNIATDGSVTVGNGGTSGWFAAVDSNETATNWNVKVVGYDRMELVDADGDGIYTVETKKLDSVEELQAAINNAQPGDVIKLDGDIIGSITIPEGLDITIDLNGHKIVGTDGEAAVTNNGTLKVTDNSTEKTGQIIGVGNGSTGIANNGTLNIESVEGGIYGGAASADDVDNLTGTNSSGINNAEGGKVTVTDSTVAGGTNGIVSSGELTVTETESGNTVIEGDTAIAVTGGNATISGGDITGTTIGVSVSEGATANITGGTITGSKDGNNGKGEGCGIENSGTTTVGGNAVVTGNYTSGIVNLGDLTVQDNAQITGKWDGISNGSETVKDATVTMTGGTVSGGNFAICDYASESTNTITGGTLVNTTGNGGAVIGSYNTTGGTWNIATDGNVKVENGSTSGWFNAVDSTETPANGQVKINGYDNIKLTDNGDGEYVVEKKINTLEALTEAINNAQPGDVIKLEGDIIGSITIPAGKNVVLDLNGYSITCANGDAVQNYGTLTIKDSSADKTGLIQATNNNDAIHNQGHLTIESGTIDGSKDGINQLQGGTTVVNGGTIKGNNCAICDSGSSQDNQINGGTLIAGGASDGYVIRGWKETSSTEDAPTWTIATNGSVTMKNETTPENLIYTGEDGTASDKYNEVNVSNFDSIKFVDNGNGGYTVQEKTTVEADRLAFINLSLNGGIGVNLYFDLPETYFDGKHKLAYQVAGGEIKYILVDKEVLEQDVDGTWVFSISVDAKQMTDEIKFWFVDDSNTYKVRTTTVADYAYYILGADISTLNCDSNDSTQLKALMAAMLNYGAEAQTYFNYNTDDLANKNLSSYTNDNGDNFADYFTDIDGSMFNDNNSWNVVKGDFYASSSANGEGIVGIDVGLGGTTSLNIKFRLLKTSSIDDYKFVITHTELYGNGNYYNLKDYAYAYSVESDETYNYYYVSIVGIPAPYLDHTYRMEFMKAGEKVATIETMVTTYIKQAVENSTDEALTNIVTRLYWYNYYANLYFKY